MNIIEIRDFLLKEGYMTDIGKDTPKYHITERFYTDISKETKRDVSRKLFSTRLLTDSELYKRFLEDAKVPKMRNNRDGEAYLVGGFTKTGAKTLKGILDKGADYKKLCIATRKYYSGTDLCTKVDRFLKEGLWETFYEMVDDDEELRETLTVNNIGNINKRLG